MATERRVIDNEFSGTQSSTVSTSCDICGMVLKDQVGMADHLSSHPKCRKALLDKFAGP